MLNTCSDLHIRVLPLKHMLVDGRPLPHIQMYVSVSVRHESLGELRH